MTDRSAQWVRIGIVGRPHGLGGAFFVSQRDEQVPKKYAKVRIGDDPESAEVFEIRATRMQAGRPLLHLKSHSRREAVESYVGQIIWVARHLVEIDNNEEYIWHDLIGSVVEDNGGSEMGKVVGVTNYGASDIVSITDRDGRTLDIPIVGNYVLVEKIVAGEPIKLNVSAEVFESLWTPVKG